MKACFDQRKFLLRNPNSSIKFHHNFLNHNYVITFTDAWVWSRTPVLSDEHMAIIDAKIAEICLTQDQFVITEQNEGESLILFIGGCGGGGNVPSAPLSVNFFHFHAVWRKLAKKWVRDPPGSATETKHSLLSISFYKEICKRFIFIYFSFPRKTCLFGCLFMESYLLLYHVQFTIIEPRADQRFPIGWRKGRQPHILSKFPETHGMEKIGIWGFPALTPSIYSITGRANAELKPVKYDRDRYSFFTLFYLV